jgi:DMSO/TMAO reductase YedYZ molybdopterin-dependent catalytic subunit
MRRRSFLRLALLALAGCNLPPSLVFRRDSDSSPTLDPASTPLPAAQANHVPVCNAGPIVAPTLPAETPDADLYEPSTGLHVKNYEVVNIDPVRYRLKISGLVDHPLEFSLADLCSMPKITSKVVCTCRGYFEDVTTYTGVPLSHIFELAGIQNGATAVYLTGAEGFPGWISLEDALLADNFLAYQWLDQPLPITHGFPLRAVIPQKNGYAWTKFLAEIKVESA